MYSDCEALHEGPLAEALSQVTWYPAVPLAVQRVAGIERAQMLLESPARGALQRVLAAGQPLLHALRADPAHRAIVRWAVDVDPLAVSPRVTRMRPCLTGAGHAQG